MWEITVGRVLRKTSSMALLLVGQISQIPALHSYHIVTSVVSWVSRNSSSSTRHAGAAQSQKSDH